MVCVTLLSERMGVEALRSILRDMRHSGFPVVRATPAGQVLRD